MVSGSAFRWRPSSRSVGDMKKMRVLAAVTVGGAERISGVLAEHEVFLVETLQKFHDAIDAKPFDMVIIDADFEGSIPFEALQRAVSRSDPAPVVCVRTLSSEQLGPASFDALCTACDELGVNCVLDLPAFPDDNAGNAQIAHVLRRLIDLEVRPASQGDDTNSF